MRRMVINVWRDFVCGLKCGIDVIKKRRETRRELNWFLD